jgi:hypothetical protein
MIEVYVSHLIGESPVHHEFNIKHNCITDIKGNEVISIEDEGDGIVIKIDDQELELDYHQEEALLALLLSRQEGGMKLIRKIIEI